MQLVCPECSTSYRIADGAIGAQGRTVKCARCGHGWHQDPEPDSAAAEAAEAPVEAAEADSEPAEETPAPEVVAADADEADESGPVDVAEEDEPGSEDAAEAGEEAETEAKAAGEDAAAGEPAEAAEVIEGEAVEIEPPERPARRRRPPPAPPKRRVSTGWVVLIIVLFVIAGGAFIYRAEIVKAWPPAGKFYRTLGVGMPALELGLDISNVRYSQENRNGKPVLLISGQISNVGIDERRIPEIRVSLFDNKKRELNHWTVPLAKDRLAPGEAVSFSTQMANPPKNTKDFAITFILKR